MKLLYAPISLCTSCHPHFTSHKKKKPGHVNIRNGYKSEKGDLPYNTLAAAGYSPALLLVMPGASWRMHSERQTCAQKAHTLR